MKRRRKVKTDVRGMRRGEGDGEGEKDGREEGREFGSTGYRNIRLSIRKTKWKPCLTEASLWGLKCYLV